MILELLAVSVLLLLYVAYKWLRRNDDYFKARGIPYMQPTLLLGNTGGLFLGRYNMMDLSEKMYNSIPNEKLIGAFDFTKPIYFALDPELVRQISIKDFDHFEDHSAFIDDKVDKMFGNSLIMLTGQKWREMRATLSPAFTGSEMRQMFELVLDCAEDLTRFLSTETDADRSFEDEIKNVLAKTSNDIIASCAFGIKVNSFENDKNEFLVAGKAMTSFTIVSFMRTILVVTMPKLAKMLNIQFIPSHFFKRMVLETIEERQERNIFRPDMINIVMRVRQGLSIQSSVAEDSQIESNDSMATTQESDIGKMKVHRQWTDDELVAQCFLFYIAGFDNVSGTSAFTAYALAVDPDIQNKLYEEIRETNEKLAGKRLDYESLQKMQYLDQVVCETLRMWPSLPVTDRVCVKDYVYDDGTLSFKMQKGDAISIPIYSFHHDEKYFSEPHRFVPERFSPENKSNIVPGTYLPFGTGPRNCIGSRFALMVVKAIIYHLLLNFSLHPNSKTQIPLKFKKANPFGVAAEKGIFFDVKPRH